MRPVILRHHVVTLMMVPHLPVFGTTESVSIYRQLGSKHLRNHLDW